LRKSNKASGSTDSGGAPCREVVRTAVQTLERPLAEQGFTVKMEIDDSVPDLQADPDAMIRAVLNLLFQCDEVLRQVARD